MEDLEKFLSDFFSLISTFCNDKAKEMVSDILGAESHLVIKTGVTLCCLFYSEFGYILCRFYSNINLFCAIEWCFQKDRCNVVFHERERVMNRPGFIRAFFVQLLNLCEAEKNYYNLGFLFTKTKIFVNLRKDSSLRAMYDSLRVELHRLEALPTPSSDPIAQAIEKLITPLATQLCHFSTARQQLIDLYEKIYNLGIGTKHLKYEELRGSVEAIIEMHILPHPLLSSVRNCISWECESLMHCLGAQTKLEEWNMLPSLMHLHAAHSRLNLWEKSIQVKESWKIGFLKSPTQPPLYQWLWKFRAHLVNKFTLYFYTTLSQQTTPQEMRSYLSSKNNTDLYIKLHNLQKKCLAGFIALVFDPRGLSGWKGPGYYHPGRQANAQTHQYVVMLSQPAKIGERMDGLCKALDGRAIELISPEKPFFFFNPEEKCSYLMWSVEPKVSLVVFYEGRKEDKNANIGHFTEFCSQVRGTQLLASLKPTK